MQTILIIAGVIVGIFVLLGILAEYNIKQRNKKLSCEIEIDKKDLQHLLKEVNIEPPTLDSDYLSSYLMSQYSKETLAHIPPNMTREEYTAYINQAHELLRQIRSKEYVINNPSQIL